ncbi:MAG: transposase [Candidatus Pacebacteria bacterium]|nr:transposase [Candidatus Paceibacterota bacterium]
MRKTEFANDEYYHIYNRGVDKREVFCEERDYLRFLIDFRLFNNTSKKEKRDFILKNKLSNSELGSGYPEPSSELDNLLSKELLSFLKSLPKLVEIICYCLNPNHYHFILKQLMDNGISKFMHKLDLGFTHYFNIKYDRSGSLFQGPFKAKHIDTNEYLLWLSGYVNGNAEIHKIAKAENYKWCSYQDYLGIRNGTLCDKKIILSQFKDIGEYKKYVEMVIRESSKRKDMEEYFIEKI